MNYIDDITAYFADLKNAIDLIDKADLNTVMNILVKAKEEGRQVFIMGNGGSAATASHYVCDFNKGISFGQEKKFKLICLNDNIPTMMAIANDISYDNIFLYPLQTYYLRGDVVIGLSGSGNSENVVRALNWANEHGAVTIGLTGYSGGKVMKICKHNVHVPVNDMQITEDLHMVLDHCMMKILSNKD